MNDLFRARAVEFWTENIMSTFKPSDYMDAVFESADLTKELASLCQGGEVTAAGRTSDRLGQRFINIVYREDDPIVWANFVRHEQERKDSPWKRKKFDGFADRMEEWRKSLDDPHDPFAIDPVVIEVQHKGRMMLARDERVRVGLLAFRSMLRRLCGEKQ